MEQLKCIEPDAELWAALQKMDRDGVNQLPVTRDNHVIGMLSREDVITFLRTLQELGTDARCSGDAGQGRPIGHLKEVALTG